MNTAIWWIRRDLRLADNQALTAALNHAARVVPVFVFDPALLNSPYTGSKRLTFLIEGLHKLDAHLQKRGSRLIIRRGHPQTELAKLVSESGAEAIFAEADHSPFARRRDARIAEHLPLHLTDGVTAHPPGAVLKGDGTPYTVYTPFSKAWKALPQPGPDDLLPVPKYISTPSILASQPIPEKPALPNKFLFAPGEKEAQCRLKAFLGQLSQTANPKIFAYADARNRMDIEGTSGLSPYLRFGMLSARQAVVAAREAIELAPTDQAHKGATTWLNELIWREFYVSILYHFPQVRRRSFRPQYDDITWDNNEAAFAAWCQGLTGYPVVDAAMRQLVQTGWMHNRARMIVASFLVKDLLVDWRWGEQFFMQHLIDGDPAANNGGWQWTAGTGTDAAPYFRVFNPILQSKKFDPDGDYIRRWVPELHHVPLKFIHNPWEMSMQAQQQVGCLIGKDYPTSIIDHKWARNRALAAYGETK
jgi:deoxyribodipyrimidine photo-lyase